MSVTPGADITAEALNAEAVAVAQTFAANASRAIALFKYVNQLGVSGLETAGFDQSADAEAFLTGCSYLNTVGQVIDGTADVPNDFDFTSAVAAFVGPNPVIG